MFSFCSQATDHENQHANSCFSIYYKFFHFFAFALPCFLRFVLYFYMLYKVHTNQRVWGEESLCKWNMVGRGGTHYAKWQIVPNKMQLQYSLYELAKLGNPRKFNRITSHIECTIRHDNFHRNCSYAGTKKHAYSWQILKGIKLNPCRYLSSCLIYYSPILLCLFIIPSTAIIRLNAM